MSNAPPGQTEEYKQQLEESISFVGRGVDFFTQAKANRLLRLAQNRFGDISGLKVLDVGCGVGLTDKLLVDRIGALHGVDINPAAVESSSEANPTAHYQFYDGSALPFPESTFDLVFAINVLHHVAPSTWDPFVKEMRRVTKRQGLVVVFEHNPLNPLTRLAVSRCQFDENVRLVAHQRAKNLFTRAGLTFVDGGYIIFFPIKSELVSWIESRLGWLPLGAQHYLVGMKEEPSGRR
jgi:ubiquinone/menaquinone biosynthesis C-methylase UbiE